MRLDRHKVGNDGPVKMAAPATQGSASGLCTAGLVALPQPGSALHAQWQQLAEATGEPVVFSEPAFVLAASRHVEGGDQVRLLIAQDRDGLAFALPVRTLRRYRRVPLPGVGTWQHDYCFLGSPLIRDGATEAAWGAVLDLGAIIGHWLVLTDLAADGPGWHGLQRALRRRGVVAAERDRHDRAVAYRRAEPTYLRGRVRGVHLKGFRRQRHLLGENVALRVRTGDPAAVEQFLALEAAGWKGRDGGAMAVRGRHGDVLRDVVRTDPARCEVFSLEADGQPAAMQINLRRGEVSYCFKTSYDEKQRRQSPGLLLMIDVLQAFHADHRLGVLDSCAVAGHPMAERLLPDRRTLTSLLIPLTPAGRCAAWCLTLTDRLRARIGHTRELP